MEKEAITKCRTSQEIPLKNSIYINPPLIEIKKFYHFIYHITYTQLIQRIELIRAKKR
jgi:hypothetical protein